MTRGYRLRYLSSRFLSKNNILRMAIILMYAAALGVALFYGYQRDWYGLFQHSSPLPMSVPVSLSVPARAESHPSTLPVDLEETLLPEGEEVAPSGEMKESELVAIFRHQEEGRLETKTTTSGKGAHRGVRGRQQARMKKIDTRKKPFRLTGHQV